MKPQAAAAATEKREFAYETKFLVPDAVAEDALAWMRSHLSPDPFASGASHDAYCVNSVYLDTPEFAVFHRVGSFGRCKYRVRRYGQENGVFLERKLKTRGLVGKRRTRVQDSEVTDLSGDNADPGWVGFWFHRRLIARRLEPKCQIAYDRIARVGSAPDGPIRMTLDRNLRAFPTSDWFVQESGPWTPLLDKQCIIELKYRKVFPELYQSLVSTLNLQAQAVSKYRMAVQKFGWTGESLSVMPAPVNGHAVANLSDAAEIQNHALSAGSVSA
ncbi:MAG: polyphosphate polymerase domain-containing protein [Pedosphaera sp.]|nr:polyphosphate polymerase domain-containing protein [Pedosphaera sp.]